MTVKHKGKNVSAENEEILIDLTMSPDGILSLIKKNQYTGESNLNDPDTIDLTGIRLRVIPLENMAALNALEADSTKEEYKKTHIFLVPTTTNDEGIKAEYIYIEKDNHTWGFEKIGSTNIDLTTKLDISQTSYKGKNVVVDGTTGNITFENKPTIPQASSSTPLKDTTNGAIGSSTNWATADHQHPKSDLYAEETHSHTISDIPTAPVSDGDTTNVPTCDDVYDAITTHGASLDAQTQELLDGLTPINVLVTYTDNSTETITLLKYEPNSGG